MAAALRLPLVVALGLSLFGCGAAAPSAKPPSPSTTATDPPELTRALAEAGELEAMLKATPPNAKDRSALLRRLAETYYAIQAYEEGALDAGAKGDAAQRAEKVCATARKNVQRDYEQLLELYPKYPLRDEVTFFLADEYLPHCLSRTPPLGAAARASRHHAVEIYRRVIDLTPSSKYVSAARLGVAEVLFDEATEGTTSWSDVLPAYQSLVESTETSAHVYAPYALYKEGFVYQHLGDCAKAGDAFRQAIDALHDDPTLAKGKAAAIADECAKELERLPSACP